MFKLLNVQNTNVQITHLTLSQMVLVLSKSWLCFLSVWFLQCLNVMSCPEEVVCCVCRRCQRDRMKMCLWLRAAAAAAAAAAAQLAPVFTAALSRITWLLTAPTLTSRGHSSIKNLQFLVCFVLLAHKSWQICIFFLKCCLPSMCGRKKIIMYSCLTHRGITAVSILSSAKWCQPR